MLEKISPKKMTTATAKAKVIVDRTVYLCSVYRIQRTFCPVFFRSFRSLSLCKFRAGLIPMSNMIFYDNFVVMYYLLYIKRCKTLVLMSVRCIVIDWINFALYSANAYHFREIHIATKRIQR